MIYYKDWNCNLT